MQIHKSINDYRFVDYSKYVLLFAGVPQPGDEAYIDYSILLTSRNAIAGYVCSENVPYSLASGPITKSDCEISTHIENGCSQPCEHSSEQGCILFHIWKHLEEYGIHISHDEIRSISKMFADFLDAYKSNKLYRALTPIEAFAMINNVETHTVEVFTRIKIKKDMENGS